jgi:LmbE family N-acetylglucosaminyl deacetylase
MPNAVYISPHLDDAVYSCGGLIARQVGQDQPVTVLTICAGDPPPGLLTPFAEELHGRWGAGAAAVAIRREEDLDACARLGAAAIHLGIADAIYRKSPKGEAIYPDEAAIFASLSRAEDELAGRLAEAIDQVSPAGAQLYAPVGFGGHVDHQLARRAAERLDRPLWLYRDFPYSARGFPAPDDFPPPDGVATVLPLDEYEVEDWVQAAWRYESQRSTFWQDLPALRKELRTYLADHHGIPIFAPSRRRSLD